MEHIFNDQYYTNIATRTMFPKDHIEKLHRITHILDYLNSESILTNCLAVKGSCAVNLTVFNLPRLVNELDLDYCLPVDRETMFEYRNIINQEMMKFVGATDFRIGAETKTEKSKDIWILKYTNILHQKDTLQVSINYSLRNHIFNAERKTIIPNIFNHRFVTTVLNAIEIYTMKIQHLLSEPSAIDLYDVQKMFVNNLFSEDQLKTLTKCLVFYQTIMNGTRDYKFSFEAIDKINPEQVKFEIRGLVSKNESFNLNKAKIYVKEQIEPLLKLNEPEKAYLSSFEAGIFKPSILFQDNEILERIEYHPMALWRIKQITG